MLKRKDVYPYEWVDLYEKFKHPSLPEKKCFYSSLRDGKRGRSNGIFMMSNIYIYKMFGKNLILIRLKIFMIII